MNTLSHVFCAAILTPVLSAQFTPELLQYQFNEVRGGTVTNTASTPALPATGTVNNTTWQSDPGRPLYRGNEAGFGCLGFRGTAASWVHTGWHVSQTGSFTVMFWMRRDLTSTGTNPFGYAFGNVTFRAFAAGAGGQGITFRGTAIGNVDSGFPVINTPGVWQHVTLVVDDVAGQALWFDNGTPSANVVSFTPNTFSYSNTTRFMAVAAQGDSGLSPFGLHYDMDDFRYYSRALTQPEILVAMAAENPSAGTFGTACAGPGGAPVISANGLPQIGNAGFAVDLTLAENNRLCALVLGLAPAAFGTLDLSGFLGAGCALQVDGFSLIFQVTSASAASQPLPIPPSTGFLGLHIYGQWLIAGTSGAVTSALDINIQ